MNLITITHYERPEMLRRLLEQIERQGHDFRVIVFDDGSECFDELVPWLTEWDWLELDTGEHCGRLHFWELMDNIFDVVQGRTFDYWFHMPDDVRLRPSFFGRGITYLNELRRLDDKTICLNPLRLGVSPRMQWTGVVPWPTMDGLAYKTQWNDCCWIAERNFGKALDWTINPIEWDITYADKSSSRVGWQISTRLHEAGWSMYQVTSTLLDHGNHESKMNPEERKANPLTT